MCVRRLNIQDACYCSKMIYLHINNKEMSLLYSDIKVKLENGVVDSEIYDNSVRKKNVLLYSDKY